LRAVLGRAPFPAGHRLGLGQQFLIRGLRGELPARG
jgi:hypothetical protein